MKISATLISTLLVVSIMAPAVCPAQCLVEKAAYWRMDDVNRPFFESKKQIAHETCSLPENPDCPVMIHSGQYGSALQFSGNTGITIERSGVFEWAGRDSFSIELWMKRDNRPLNAKNNEVIIGRYEPPPHFSWWIGVSLQGVITVSMRDRDRITTLCKGSKILTDDKWHHIVFVRDSDKSENRVYVDGILESRKFATYIGDDALKSDTAKISIGWHNTQGHTYNYQGAVDEIAIYQSAVPTWFIREQYGAVGRYGAPCE